MSADDRLIVEKKCRIGTLHGRSVRIEVELRESKRHGGYVLSITGEVAGSFRHGGGSFGQIIDTLLDPELVPAPGWEHGEIAALHAIWDRWHLNDMRSACLHQRDWPFDEELTLQELTWGDSYYQMRQKAENGELEGVQYAAWSELHKLVQSLTTASNRPKHPVLWGAEADALIEHGWLKFGRSETTAARWTYPSEHPQGLLAKPCPECGYKYGSAWLYEPLPQDVIDWVMEL